MTELGELVYVVTSGEYSDYRIDAIFSTEEQARAYIAAQPRETYYPSGWPRLEYQRLEYHVLNRRNDAYGPWCIWMRRDGTVTWSGRMSDDETGSAIHIQNIEKPHEHVARIRIWARSEEQAIKAANEHRARWIADGTWPEVLTKSVGVFVLSVKP